MPYLLLMFLFSACDFSEKSPTDKEDDNRVIDLPAFAVEPFNYVVGSNNSQSAGLFVTPISCEQQLKKLNDTSREVQEKVIPTPTEDKLGLAKALAAYSYALGLFYDCNMRQQAQEDGAEEIATDQQKVQYRAASLTESRWDLTRFVDWFEYKNSEGIVSRTDGEADRIDGKMINLYLQEDGARTQTRIDLAKDTNLRQITTIFWSQLKSGEQTALKSHVVEYSQGSTKEQLLSLRYHDANHDPDESWWVLAHMKASGSVIITNVCSATNDYNSSCDAESANDSIHHLDENYQPVANHQDFKASRADFLEAEKVDTNWSHGDYSTDAINPLTPFFAGNGNAETNRQTVMSDGLPSQ